VSGWLVSSKDSSLVPHALGPSRGQPSEDTTETNTLERILTSATPKWPRKKCPYKI
jgi:hypothetical protein